MCYLCGMKFNKNIIFLFALMFIILASGCKGGLSYDKRLLTADSLMWVNADSALSLLQDMGHRDLSGGRNRAYHALLLTQARYRCYVPATSDSAINVALEYYEQHPEEREKLSRAHLYKGAVMEELNQIEAAMTHYKKALETAATDDNFNQGYIRLRIGHIYRDHLVADSTDITYFKEALRYFKQVPDSFYIMTCLNAIGTSYYKNNRDSVEPYLDKALDIAKRNGYAAKEREIAINIAKTTMFKSRPEDIEKAKNTVLPLLVNRSGCSPENLADPLMTASYTLAKQNKTDSALLFLNQLPEALPNPRYESFRLLCQAEIARSQRDIDQYARYSEEYRQLKESVINDEMQCQLRNVESRYDNETLKLKNERYRMMLTSWLLFALLALSVLIILLLLVMRKSSQRKRQLSDMEDTIERMQEDAIHLSALLEDNKAMGESLKETLKNQIYTFSQLVSVYQAQYKDDPNKFEALFKKAYSAHQPDASFWNGIQNYANTTHGGIIAQVIKKHPSLKNSDIRFLSLCCCDLPTTVIMMCMGYKDAHSFYNKKRRVAKVMGLQCKLDEFIAAYVMSPVEDVAQQPPEQHHDEEEPDKDIGV